MRSERNWTRRLSPYLRRSSVLVTYGVAVVAVVIAALIRAALEPVSKDISPFILFTPVVMFAAWFGGLGPGLVATFLGAVIGEYYWIGETNTFLITRADEAIHTAVFIVVGLLLSVMSRALENARQKADAANHAKDRFLAVLSHELRNPLAPVMAAVCSIEQTESLTPELRQDLDVIRRNVTLQTRLIDDLLDANRVSSGKLHLRWEVCDAHEVLEHALEVCRPDATAKGISLNLAPTAARHHVRADPARLQQVFWNVLRNALKFTPPGGSVTVTTSDIVLPSPVAPAAPALRVQVCDTGMGIDAQDLTRIFAPFEQGSAEAARHAGGLGLGLALARAILQTHSGTIRAHSDGPGKGATFTIELPTVNAPVPQPAAPPPSPPAVHAPPLKVLLVEDDPDAGPLLQRLLSHSGYDVTLAAAQTRALEAAADAQFDLIISDIALPDGNGVDLLRQIRARQPIHSICLSGFGSDVDLQQTRDAGFEHHLVKPVDLAALRRAINQIFDKGVPRPAPPARDSNLTN